MTPATRRLSLRKERLAELSADDLVRVAGGRQPTGYTCGGVAACNETKLCHYSVPARYCILTP
jgi:hypothetical protein